MNILYLHTDDIRDVEIYKALCKFEIGTADFHAPGPTDNPEGYVKSLLTVMEEKGTEVCFSLKYFPLVSIACSAMHRRYIVYSQKPYDPALFNFTVTNDCNIIFIPDFTVSENFAGTVAKNIFFMPIGVEADRISDHVSEADSSEGYDLSITETIGLRDKLPFVPMSGKSPLKDSTKGYLEGCIACRHQIRGLPSMFHYLPSYIKEEMLKETPPAIGGDSSETADSYYDNAVFDDIVTIADRDVHFGAITGNEHFKKILRFSLESVNEDEKLVFKGPAIRNEDFFKEVKNSKVNLLIPHRNWISGISGRTMDIMAAGGFVVEPFMGDLAGLFEETQNCLFSDEMSMMSKSIYYLNHPSERVDIVNSVLDKIREEHTYECRFRAMFEYLG